MKENGYSTTAIGKMHFTQTSLDLGFEKMILSEQDGLGRLDDDYHRYLKENGVIDSFDTIDQRAGEREKAPEGYWKAYGADVSDLEYKHYSTTWIGDRCIEEISSWSGDLPHFLMVGFIKPHHPFDSPSKYADMYNPENLRLLPGWMKRLRKI